MINAHCLESEEPVNKIELTEMNWFQQFFLHTSTIWSTPLWTQFFQFCFGLLCPSVRLSLFFPPRIQFGKVNMKMYKNMMTHTYRGIRPLGLPRTALYIRYMFFHQSQVDRSTDHWSVDNTNLYSNVQKKKYIYFFIMALKLDLAAPVKILSSIGEFLEQQNITLIDLVKLFMMFFWFQYKTLFFLITSLQDVP